MNVNKGRVIPYISSLPSSTTVPIEASTASRRRSDREPRRQRMELRKSAKLIFVLIQVIMSEYESSFLSLNFPAIRLITFEADGPAPPVQEKTSGLKEAFSTSRIRCSYLSFFSCSCILYASLMSLGQVFACGLKILTSKKVLENLFSHRPLARMSRRASSSVVVHQIINTNQSLNGKGIKYDSLKPTNCPNTIKPQLTNKL